MKLAEDSIRGAVELLDGKTLKWGCQEHYEVLNLIGKGKYSLVFQAVHVPTNRKVALKVLKKVKKEKVLREISSHVQLDKIPGVIRLLDVVCDSDSKSACLVQQYVETVDFRKTAFSLNPVQLRKLLFRMGTIINQIHMQGLIHRDIKPLNFLLEKSLNVKITDFGLTQKYTGAALSSHVASRYYKSPQLLLGYTKYDFSIDCWAFGVIMAGLLFRRQPFFMGDTDQEQLDSIVKTLGTQGLALLAKDIGVDLKYQLVKNINQKVKLETLISAENSEFVTPEAISLIEKLVCYDCKQRMKMSEVLEHPFFQLQAKVAKVK